jgi:hypothetical protein
MGTGDWNNGMIPLEQGLVKHRVVVMMGVPEGSSEGATAL